uniref:Uncharacterized protein n=1 Tax=Varanus komodoensis TaxID=61221 RepID=A0A8D2KXU7_VARKO
MVAAAASQQRRARAGGLPRPCLGSGVRGRAGCARPAFVWRPAGAPREETGARRRDGGEEGAARLQPRLATARPRSLRARLCQEAGTRRGRACGEGGAPAASRLLGKNSPDSQKLFTPPPHSLSLGYKKHFLKNTN